MVGCYPQWPVKPIVLRGSADAASVRVPPGIPIFGGCNALQLGIGFGLTIVGTGFEVISGLAEVASAGAATPLTTFAIFVGAGDIAAGLTYIAVACGPPTVP